MGDVFIILILMRFGPSTALITYWMTSIVAAVADLFRRYRFGRNRPRKERTAAEVSSAPDASAGGVPFDDAVPFAPGWR